QADFLEHREMLRRPGRVVDYEISLADVFVRAAMPRIELQCPLVMPEGELELAGMAIRVAEIVLDVGVARVAERGGGERPDRGIPVLRLDGRFPRRVIRIELRSERRLVGRIGDGRRRQQRQAETEERSRDAYADHRVTRSSPVASPRAPRGGPCPLCA